MIIGRKNKTTPDLSIVERLGGSGVAKIQQLFHSAKPCKCFLLFDYLDIVK